MNVTTRATVQEIREVTPSLFLVTLRPETIRPWDPGMFLQLTLEDVDWSRPWPPSKPFSFASWGGDHIRLLIRKEGQFTSRLIENARPGLTLTVKYPFGDLVLDRPAKYCLVAGGAGISPFLSFLDFYLGRELTLPAVVIHSIRRREELVSEIYWEKIPDSIKILPRVTGEYPPPDPDRRLDISAALREAGVRDDTWQFVVSGPPQFAAKYGRSLSDAGFKHIQLESWQGGVVGSFQPGPAEGVLQT